MKCPKYLSMLRKWINSELEEMGRPKKSICNQGYDKDQMKMHLETNIGNNYDVPIFCND